MKSTKSNIIAVWTKAGAITLKSIKVVRWMSEETICFTASLVFNGEVVGTVSNEGRGGETFAHIDPSRRSEVEAFAATIDPDAIGYGFLKEYGKGVSVADICDHIIEQKDKADQKAKTIASIRKKALKGAWVIRSGDAPKTYRSFSKAIKAGMTAEACIAKAKTMPDTTVVSEMSDEAIEAHFIG